MKSSISSGTVKAHCIGKLQSDKKKKKKLEKAEVKELKRF